MDFEQYPVAVRSFSSQYGPPYSATQVVKNVCGEPAEVSQFGDNQYAAAFRSFGEWHQYFPSHHAFPKLQTPRWFSYTDFMECSFSQPVYAFSVKIQENFFPGSVRRLSATKHSRVDEKDTSKSWQVLWVKEGTLKEDAISLFEYKFPAINFPKTLFPVDVIRIEFDFTHSEYFYQLEAVKLIGEKHIELSSNDADEISQDSWNNSFNELNQSRLDNTPGQAPYTFCDSKLYLEPIIAPVISPSKFGAQSIDLLPNELLIKILGFLEIDDLCRASRINKLFNHLSKDSALYVSISLRPFYMFLVDNSILRISRKCTALQKLDLSWLGPNNQISTNTLCSFLRNVPNIVELRLSACQMLASSVLETLAIYCSNLELIDVSYCNNGLQLCISWLTNLKKLRYLNVAHTLISTSELLVLLKKLDNLEWLMLGSPALIADQDAIISSLTQKPCGSLKGIELWYWDKISFSCISQFLHSHGRILLELDLGWCLGIGVNDILPTVAATCPNLVVLFLTAHHETTDTGLNDLTKGCPQIEQLDLLGSRNISYSALEFLVTTFENLIYLDVSYCSKLSVEDVANLQALSPQISIKHVETYMHRHINNVKD